MNEISNASANALMPEYSAGQKYKEEDKSAQELGQKAFLKLMITQMENQDPLSPQDNGEFIAQLAQFSSVESLDKMNNNFDTFAKNFVASQALEASSLVGRSVTVPTDSTLLPEGGAVTTLIDVPASTGSVMLNIYDEGGALVEQIDTGAAPAGERVVRWDGAFAEVDGNVLDWRSQHEAGLPAGKYRIEAVAAVDGKSTQLDSYLSANVNSVTIGARGNLTLNLAGIGAVSLADVKQFNE